MDFPLVEQPFAAAFDFSIHRIRGQSQFARPGDYAVNELHLLKFWETGQMREYAPKKSRQEFHRAFHPS